MVRSTVVEYDDPQAYQAAVRPAQVDIVVTTKGDFQAKLRRIEFSRLWVQRGHETLSRVANSAANADRPPIFFLTSPDQAPINHSGRVFGFGEIAVAGSGFIHHHVSAGPCQWATVSLTRKDFTTASYSLVGHDQIDRSVTHYLRPTPHKMAQLLTLHKTVGQLAEANILIQHEITRAIEEALLRAVIMCLSESETVQMGWGVLRHTTIVARFEDMLAANYDRPLHLAEICAAIGASERTLRISCMEHLGMGPIRYLWLRRMHLTHRALISAVPGTSTVTKIATDNGFWELGRFAVEYRALFGEAPSETLRRLPTEMRARQSNPFAFADSDYA